MAAVDARPAEETCHGRSVQESVEHCTSIVRKVQEGKQAESRCHHDRAAWDATPSGMPEEGGSSTLVGLADEDMRSRIDVGVSS